MRWIWSWIFQIFIWICISYVPYASEYLKYSTPYSSHMGHIHMNIFNIQLHIHLILHNMHMNNRNIQLNIHLICAIFIWIIHIQLVLEIFNSWIWIIFICWIIHHIQQMNTISSQNLQLHLMQVTSYRFSTLKVYS